ncbi:MAG TPA: 5'-nucleotidase C-terminal domain-containing protein [Roseiflexaceae bacterium]|nr:5'-nucleotidase C-terminal domain-containing protein [Roseiflexaceae bacterium]
MAHLTRRAFLRGTVALGAGAMLLKFSDGSYRIVTAASGPVTYKLRIIHTNDHHARIEPVNLTIGSGNPAPTRDFGGVARRKTLFDQIRSTNTGNDGLLFLDAGDVFQGTLYFNLYEGYADLDFYRQLGYDAMAIGNHEFDRGDEPLAKFIDGATTGTYPNPPQGQPGTLGGTNFPVLSANITVAGGPLAGKIQPRTTKTVGGKKIGIFSLTPSDTSNISSPSANVTFGSDYAGIAQAQVDALRGEGCQIIIGLTHIGHEQDLALAAAVRGINVIVGGHSHTPLLPAGAPNAPLGVTSQGVYPKVVNDPDGNTVLVVTDWEWGKWVGDLTVGFNGTDQVVGAEAPSTVWPVWGAEPSNRALLPNEGAAIAADTAFQTKITDVYKPPIAALQATKIGATAVLLDGARANVRTRETNLANLITDTLRERILAAADNDPNKPVVAITNGGGIRASINAGDVTVGNVLEVLPFGNTIAYVDVTGAQLLAALENGVSQAPAEGGRFAQVAGLRFTYIARRPAGNRVVRVEVLEGTAYAPLNPTKIYRVATNNFLLTGGDGYSALAQGTGKVDTGLVMADEVQNRIAALSANGTQPLTIGVEGRILALTPRQWLPSLPRLGATTASLKG